MGLINYDVALSPEKPQIFLKVGATPTSLSVTADHVGDFSLSCEPTTGTIVGGVVTGTILGFFAGGPAGALLGGVGGPVALLEIGKVAASKMADGMRDGIKGQSQTINFSQPLGFSLPAGDVTVNVTLKTLELSTFNGMLMGTGDVQVG